MHVLAFFAASDGIVLENLALRFMAGGCPARLFAPVLSCCYRPALYMSLLAVLLLKKCADLL